MSERYEGNVRLVRVAPSGGYDYERTALEADEHLVWITADGYPATTTRGHIGDRRPLVVIDAEDAEEVKRLRDTFHRFDCLPSDSVVSWQDVLRQLNTPKPDEPEGLGSVIRSGRMHVYMRFIGGQTELPAWVNVNNLTGAKARWRDFTGSIEVLSQGVQS